MSSYGRKLIQWISHLPDRWGWSLQKSLRSLAWFFAVVSLVLAFLIPGEISVANYSGDASAVKEILRHLFAIFVELALVLWFVEMILKDHEKQQGIEKRSKQLHLMKSVLFRMELQDLYVADFLAFQDKDITLGNIAIAEIGKLEEWKKDLHGRSDAVWHSLFNKRALQRVLDEYVKAEPVWRDFKQFALMCDGFDDVLRDMITIQHLIADVNACKKAKSEDGREASEVRNTCASTHEDLVIKVWKTGIMKFVDYAVGLKREDAYAFGKMMDEYEKAEKRAKAKEEPEWRVKEREAVKDNVAAVTGEIFQTEVIQQTRIIISEERN